MPLIEGWWSIPYCAIIWISWVLYNIYWADNDEDLVILCALFSMLWVVITIIYSFTVVGSDDYSRLFYIQYIPLFLLSFFGTISGIKYLIIEDKLSYEYVIYAVPILLTLTLFFI